MASWDRFLLHFGIMLVAKSDDVSCYLLASFFNGFWMAPGYILGAMLVDFWNSFLILFPPLGKMANASKLL